MVDLPCFWVCAMSYTPTECMHRSDRKLGRQHISSLHQHSNTAMNKISTVNTAMNDMTCLCKQLEEFVFLHKQKLEALFKTVGNY